MIPLNWLRKDFPLVLTFLFGLVVMVSKFLNLAYFKLPDLTKTLDKWSQITFAFAILVGVINLSALHINYIRKRRAGYWYSVIAMATLVLYGTLGMAQGPKGAGALFIYSNVLIPIGSAIYALLGFYIVSAAYRSFHLRSLEATVLIVASVLLMLGQAPIGQVLWYDFPKLSNWIMTVPNSAGIRGIQLGAAIGAFAVSIRILLGLERSWFGSGGGQ